MRVKLKKRSLRASGERPGAEIGIGLSNVRNATTSAVSDLQRGDVPPSVRNGIFYINTVNL